MGRCIRENMGARALSSDIPLAPRDLVARRRPQLRLPNTKSCEGDERHMGHAAIVTGGVRKSTERHRVQSEVTEQKG